MKGKYHYLITHYKRSQQTSMNAESAVELCSHECLEGNKNYLLWRYDSGTVGSNQPGLFLGQQGMLYFHHVVLRNAFGDADNQWHFGFDCLKNRFGSPGRWDVNHGGVRSRGLFCLLDRVEHGQIEVRFTALSG